jgi:cytidylate kinase
MEIRLESDVDIYRVIGNGTDISGAIREPEVSAAASPVSAVPGVREALVIQQQRMAAQVNVVMDGRDIGTKVLPDADCKIFLVADVMERAKRRTLELKERGIDANIDEVAAEICERDERDSTRAHSPLKQAEDAILLDTTNLTIEQVAEEILAISGQ